MVPTIVITDYLVQRTVIFLCDQCGETVKMVVPAREGGSTQRSYCCRATYQVTNVDEREGDILVVRLPDRENGELARVANAVPERPY